MLLLADGQTIAQVSTALACGQSTMYRWVALWRTEGVGSLAEGPHLGRLRRLDPTAEAQLQAVLGSDPHSHGHHATGWTVPLLLGELAARGWVVHEHTLRRTLKRLGYRWKRPQYVLGRPDPAYAEKKGDVVKDAAAMLAQGGEAWVADETALREFPPLARIIHEGDNGASIGYSEGADSLESRRCPAWTSLPQPRSCLPRRSACRSPSISKEAA